MNEWRNITNTDASTQVQCMVLQYKNAEQADFILILNQDGKRIRSKRP